MSQVRVQRTIQVRSDNRRDWRGRTEIVNYLGQTLFQKSEHGHTNEGFVLCEGRFGRGVAYDGVFEGPKRLDVDWGAYGHGHRPNGMRGGGKMAASPSRSKGSRLDSLHHNFKTARRTLQKMTSWSRRTHGITDQKFVQPAGDSFFLCLYLSGRSCGSTNACLVVAHRLNFKRFISRPIKEDEWVQPRQPSDEDGSRALPIINPPGH